MKVTVSFTWRICGVNVTCGIIRFCSRFAVTWYIHLYYIFGEVLAEDTVSPNVWNMLFSHSVISRRTVILAWLLPVVGLLMRSNTHKFTRNVVHVSIGLGWLPNCETTNSCCLCVHAPTRMVLVKIPVEITCEILYI